MKEDIDKVMDSIEKLSKDDLTQVYRLLKIWDKDNDMKFSQEIKGLPFYELS